MTNDKQRERLVELIQASVNGYARNWAETIADYLLANGVIVAPVSVGQTVYAVDKRTHLWWKGKAIVISCANKNSVQIAVRFEDGEVAVYEANCVFLTREEAEQALKGGAE